MLIYWFLPMILFLGIVTSYEDIKYGKIRNKWIIIALSYSILLNILLFFIWDLELKYFYSIFFNLIFSLIIGIMIWYLGLWTSGDAKLFFSYVALLPPLITTFNLNNIFSLDLLVNTFIILTLFLIFSIFKNIKIMETLPQIKKSFSLYRIFNIALLVFGLTWIIGLASNFIGIRNNFLIILILFFLIISFERFLSINLILIMGALSILRLILDPSIFTAVFWINYIEILIFFIIFRFILLDLSYSVFTKKIRIDKSVVH